MLAPCDWIEHDEYGKYVVEVHGRTDELEYAVLKIHGYRPYFYIEEDSAFQKILHETGVRVTITPQEKYDVYQGFRFYEKTRVWKLEVDSLKDYRTLVKLATTEKLGVDNKPVKRRVYEANLPPLLRFYHDHSIVPASPLKFTATSKLKGETKGWNVHHINIKSDTTNDTPLKIAAYDIECMSKSGQFPIACKHWNYIIEKILDDIDDAPEDQTLYEIFKRRLEMEGCTKKLTNLLGFLRQEKVLQAIDNKDSRILEKGIADMIGTEMGDPVIQIGITIRWSNSMLVNTKRRVFVCGSVTSHPEYVSCANEGDMIESFMEYVNQENPDVICGYNTYGFDDNYLFQRAKLCNVKLNLARTAVWGDMIQNKTFELASGKYEVHYLKTPGRLTIDLLLNFRREYNLDSYKLDNVASTFLRDKVTGISGSTIYTKNTRGLFVGNYVRFDIVGNTINPYRDGMKFEVKEITPKSFVIESVGDLFQDLTVEEKNCLEWSFTKDDVSPQELFQLHEGTPEDRARIAKYCIQDCDLVLTLMAKLDILTNARGMADVCFVPLQYLFLRGQGIKIFSRVAYEASQRNQILLMQESIEGDSSYEGAIVISPKIGMYLDTPVAVLDYNSLYPSSMIGENLSPDTFVCMKTYNANGKLIEYEGLENVRGIMNCHEVSYDLKDDNNKVYGKQVCVFKQPEPDNPLSVGLIPTALAIMLQKRKEARKRMEACTDDAQKSVYNGLQLAYKVVANSIYGQLGSKTSAIRKVCVAACTTAVGRRQLLFAKKTVEDDFGAEVVYGDSVTGYTPVLVRIDGCIDIVPIETLDTYGKGWKQYGDKDMCELEGIESWTEKGWTRIERVIRHALLPGKQIIRVVTPHGIVDATDDHSLLHYNGDPVSARDILIGTELLHRSPPFPVHSHSYMTEEQATLEGFFFANGLCGKFTWEVYSTDQRLLKQYRDLCMNVYPQVKWEIVHTLEDPDILGTIDSTKILHKLIPDHRSPIDFIDSFRSRLFTASGQRRIPVDVLNGPMHIRKAFWTGIQTANVRLLQKDHLSAAHIAYLANTLSYKFTLKSYKNTFTMNHHFTGSNRVTEMHTVAYNGYVYDLTTSNHHFQAGIGKLIVHNTDSIFVKFPGKNLEETIRAGQEAAQCITSRCPHKAFVIGYEKTFYPFILFCRKRYVGMKYEEDPTKCKRASMGIVLKRRDNAPIVKDVFGGALDILLETKNVQNAVDYVKNMLLQVIRGELPLEKFAITKQLRDDYKDPTRIAHRVLADRMAIRDPGNKPNVGDRLKFVYIQSDKKLQGNKIEEISYVKEKRIPLDTLFYITNQIQNPVAQLFALCIEDIAGYREPSPSYSKRYQEYLAKLEDQEEATLRVLAEKEKQLDKLLFLGADYLRNPIRSTRTGPMDAFLTKRN